MTEPAGVGVEDGVDRKAPLVPMPRDKAIEYVKERIAEGDGRVATGNQTEGEVADALAARQEALTSTRTSGLDNVGLAPDGSVSDSTVELGADAKTYTAEEVAALIRQIKDAVILRPGWRDLTDSQKAEGILGDPFLKKVWLEGGAQPLGPDATAYTDDEIKAVYDKLVSSGALSKKGWRREIQPPTNSELNTKLDQYDLTGPSAQATTLGDSDVTS